MIDGRVPKNIYGNLDIYVPSMVPTGGVHIPHPDTSRAARVLGIDYADAVTGFAFRGRHGTAIITGAVIAESCRDAVEEVISAFEDERQEEEERGRILENLRMWKKFLVGLRIRERIQGYEIEGERDVADEAMGDGDESAYDDDSGGFVPDSEMTGHLKPVSVGYSEQAHGTYDEDGGGGFMLSDEEDDGDGATISKHEIDGFHITPQRSDYQDQQGTTVYESIDDSRIVGVDENKHQTCQVGSPFERANRTKLPVDADAEARHQEPHSLAFEANKLQAPIKQHSQSRQENARTAKAPKNYTRPFQSESSHTASTDYLSQNIQPIDPNLSPSPSKPYLPDAEMAEALALQQIHDSQSLRPPQVTLNRQEANFETSYLIPSSSRRQGLASSSPFLNALPVPPTQVLSPPTQENLKVVNAKTGSPPRQEVESKKLTDDSGSEEAGSLLSRDPSDEDADPSWLDF